MKLLELLQAMFGKSYLNRIIGTKTNISKPIKLDKNSPFKVYSDSAFENPEVLNFIEKKLAEYGPYALSNKNMSEIKNFEMNARRFLNAKNKQAGVKEVKPEAEVFDIGTKKKVDDKGIMTLKKELGLPEGVEPGSIADKAIKESVEYKTKQQGVKSVLDEDYVPPKSELTLEEEAAIAKMNDRMAKGYSAMQEGKRRAVIRQILLKDNRINLPEDVEKSLRNYDDLRGGGDQNMDPLKIFEDYYERDNDTLANLDGIIDTARNEFEAANDFLSLENNFKLKKPVVRESLDDEAVEIEEIKNLDDPEDLASGGRVGFAAGTVKGILKLMQSKFGEDAIKTADKINRPERALNREMFGEFNERMSRKILDVEETPSGFKLSREKLLKNYPEIDEDFADQIMDMDRDLQLRIIAMIEDRRKNPEAYDKLLMEIRDDSLDFQGEFDRSVQRSKNADGGLNYLMGL